MLQHQFALCWSINLFKALSLLSINACCFQVRIQTWDGSCLLLERLKGIAKGRDYEYSGFKLVHSNSLRKFLLRGPVNYS